MRVLLCLGSVELTQTFGPDPFAERVCRALIGKNAVHIGAVIVRVFREAAHDRKAGARPGIELVEIRIRERGHDRTGPIRAEVEAQDAIAIMHALIVAQHTRFHEFIRAPFAIGIRDPLRRVLSSVALAIAKRLIGQLHAFPVVVSVHGVVAAGHRGDKRVVRQSTIQRFEVGFGRNGRHIAPIGEGVYGDGQPLFGEHFGGRDHMGDVRMHAAV